MKRLIVGISGASGAIYGVRILQVLREVQALADVTHDARDIAASISSGSFQTLGMVI